MIGHVIVAVLLAFGPGGSEGDFLAEFREAWQRAREFELPENVRIHYRELLYPELTDAELAELEEASEGRPDYPADPEIPIRLASKVIEAERRRRRDGPDVVEIEVWIRDEGAWRLNRTEHNERLRGEVLYVDQVVTPDLSWALTPSHLSVVDPDVPPPGRDYAVSASEFRNAMRMFVWGRLGVGERIGMEPMWARSDGKAWKARAEAPDWSVLGWSGIVETRGGADRLLPERYEFLESARSSEHVGTTMRFLEWEVDPVLGLWVAHRVEERYPDGRLKKVHEFLGAERIDAREFARVTALPTVGEPEAVRGRTTYRRILDFRSGVNRERILTEAGPIDKPMPASMRAVPESRVDLRTIGWVLAGLIVAALIGLRLWRHRSSGATT